MLSYALFTAFWTLAVFKGWGVDSSWSIPISYCLLTCVIHWITRRLTNKSNGSPLNQVKLASSNCDSACLALLTVIWGVLKLGGDTDLYILLGPIARDHTWYVLAVSLILRATLAVSKKGS
jgi:hypothetical protein